MDKEWSLIKLGKILNKSAEWIDINPNERYKQITVKIWGKGVVERNEVTGAEIAGSKRLKVKAGEFIVSRIDARHGAFGLVPDFLEGAIVTNDFPVFIPNPSFILPKYLNWMSKTRSFIDLCVASSEGTTNRVRLKEDRFLSMQIPLPPLDEQRRIVARIEELAAKVEEARGLRRQSAEEAEALFNAGKNDLFNEAFTHQWESMALGDIADIRSGVTLGRKLQGVTITLPYLRVANVQDGYLDLKSIKKVEILESEIGKWQLQFGDLLLTEGGDWDKLGRGTVWHGEISNCIHQNHIFRVRLNQQEFAPHYLSALIGSPYGKAYFQAASKQTTNLATINHRQLKAFRVFKPPLSEQHRIVTYLDNLQAKVDALKRLQTETAVELDALLPSILDKAFKGEL